VIGGEDIYYQKKNVLRHQRPKKSYQLKSVDNTKRCKLQRFVLSKELYLSI
jgi:hypothetical protein